MKYEKAYKSVFWNDEPVYYSGFNKTFKYWHPCYHQNQMIRKHYHLRMIGKMLYVSPRKENKSSVKAVACETLEKGDMVVFKNNQSFKISR